MQGFSQFITEGRDAPLYHGTDTGSAIDIIQSNEFKAHENLYDEGTPGVSFSRNMTIGNRFATNMGRFGIVFEVDQKKLAQNYKIKPFNYYSSNGTRQMDSDVMGAYNEFEERVYSDIKNADRYITKVIVLSKPGVKIKGNLILNHPLLYYQGKFVNK